MRRLVIPIALLLMVGLAAPLMSGPSAPEQLVRNNRRNDVWQRALQLLEARNEATVQYYTRKGDRQKADQIRQLAESARREADAFNRFLAGDDPNERELRAFQKFLALQCDISDLVDARVRSTPAWLNAYALTEQYGTLMKMEMSMYERLVGAHRLLFLPCEKIGNPLTTQMR
jgi:hypothetical protein